MFKIKLRQFFFIDVLLKLPLIKQAKFLICDSSGKFQNDLDDQDLMLATVHIFYLFVICSKCRGAAAGADLYLEGLPRSHIE
jgi:hypothetical protein